MLGQSRERIFEREAHEPRTAKAPKNADFAVILGLTNVIEQSAKAIRSRQTDKMLKITNRDRGLGHLIHDIVSRHGECSLRFCLKCAHQIRNKRWLQEVIVRRPHKVLVASVIE